MRERLEAFRGGWLPDYVAGRMRPERVPEGVTRHLLFMFADHWEPSGGGADEATADRRLDEWATLYPKAAAAHCDADGRAPAHSHFYPYDEFRAQDLRALAELSHSGYGEVEMHLHHRDDTSASLTGKMQDAVGLYRDFGCLGAAPDGNAAYGFVHGNWALDNSRHDCGRNFCGVNDELSVLQSTGCYADFTFPALGTGAQPRWANRIFRAQDDPTRPKSYNQGREAAVGVPPDNSFMLVPGPLAFHRSPDGRWRLDDGQITGVNVPRPDRTDAWLSAHVHVKGRPEWTIVKVYSHGCTDRNRLPFLTRELDRLWSDLESRYNDGERWRLHYLTAREMYNVIRAAEDGRVGDPNDYRDYLVSPPPCRKPTTARLESERCGEYEASAVPA
ncbi:MAG: hypothetical protein ACO1SX_09615 [Actinomycetota bacterium]